MRAVTVAAFGGPEVLGWDEVAEPRSPGPGELLIRVAAAGLNRADLLQRAGLYPPPPGAPETLGLEVSGTVMATGPGETPWQVGDEVCALLDGGGYAERVLAPAAQVLPIPPGVGLVEAAALPEAACTVWGVLCDRGHLAAGEVVLIHGGASGVGTMAVQFAAHVAGARVAVTAGSEAKLRRCRELGADVLVDYREQDFVAAVLEATGGHGADVVVDTIGAKYLARNIEVLATGGRIVTIGLMGGVRAELDLGALMAKRGSIAATALRARPAAEKAAVVAATRRDLWPALGDGRVVPVVDRVLPMSAAAEAHRVMAASEHVGKILLTP